MVVKLENPVLVESFFGGWEETIIWSCLQGVMGEIFVDQAGQPTAALAKLGNHASFGFLAGQPTLELIEHCRGEDIILVPQHDGWTRVIAEHYGEKAHSLTRYATKKEMYFDLGKLQSYMDDLPSEFSIKPIDESIYRMCLQEDWSRDLVANYKDVEDYLRQGLGFVVCQQDKVVAGASSYSTYLDGIEIEVDTHPEWQRRGLSSAVAAKLILACLAQNRYPSWDAHTDISLNLAEKLGYRFSHEYLAYEIDWN